jgi:hypothetical protein
MTKPDEAPAWDGRPENPGVRAWHWARDRHHQQSLEAWLWDPDDGACGRWQDDSGGCRPKEFGPAYVYEGPCPPPGEFRRGWDAAREAAALLIEPTSVRPCDCVVCDCGNSGNAAYAASWDADIASAVAIRAMEPPA